MDVLPLQVLNNLGFDGFRIRQFDHSNGNGFEFSRRMQKKLSEDVGFRVLAAGNEPDFRTISDFRKLHLRALQGLFDQVLQIALQAGTMKLGRVVLDGSKVKANASKHKAMSYGRMQEEEKRL
jgi:transposase